MSEQNHERLIRKAEETIILAIETSSRIGSVALALGPNMLAERRLSGPMQHSSELFPVIAALLKGHGYVPGDLDQVHIATGPGSFTGLRIAVALANAFECGVNDLPLSMILSWYEQKAVSILLTLLYLGIRDIRLGPSLPAFISPNVLNVLVEKFNIMPIKTPDEDLAAILG